MQSRIRTRIRVRDRLRVGDRVRDRVRVRVRGGAIDPVREFESMLVGTGRVIHLE